MAPGAPKKSVNADSPVKKRRVRSEKNNRCRNYKVTASEETIRHQNRPKDGFSSAGQVGQLAPVIFGPGQGVDLSRPDLTDVLQLRPDTLKDLTWISVEGPRLEDFGARESVASWFSQGQRARRTRCSESMNSEYPFLSSPYEEKWAAPFVQSSENGKEPGTKDAALQRSESHDEWSTTRQSQNNESDDQEDDNEEFSTSLSVGDGRYLVDLGSSSEFIVDEECILQLFKSCRECNKQCSVRKRVQGLKLVVYQACCFCESRYTWTNLPDEDEDDGSSKDDGELQVNGKDTAHGQTDTAVSPSRNTC